MRKQVDRPKAIVYLYTGVTGEAGAGAVRVQEGVARAWADANGYAIARVVADIGDRTQLNDSVNAVLAGEVQALAVPSIDTLGASGGTAALLAVNRVGGVLLAAREKMTAPASSTADSGTRAWQAVYFRVV